MRAKKKRAFTLIELLVVIGVTALLAGLVVSGAGIAMSQMRKNRAVTERDALVTAIEAFKLKKGYYPPDNPGNPAVNPLFYELTGTLFTESDTSYTSTSTQEKFTAANLGTLFNRNGLVNSSRDQSEIQNFLPTLNKNSRTAVVVGPGSLNYTLFGVGVPGPLEKSTVTGAKILPWSYVSTNPTNSGETGFDLWMDVFYSGKTNRISNWSKEPQPQ